MRFQTVFEAVYSLAAQSDNLSFTFVFVHDIMIKCKTIFHAGCKVQ